jgi:hypothetical protein
MTVTYEAIATATASGSQSTITFNPLPTTYTDIVLVIQGNTASLTTALRFNNDTGFNYSRTGVRGYSTLANSFRQNSQEYLAVDGSVTQPFENAIISINNYNNSTTYKNALIRTNNAGTSGVEAVIGLWYGSTAAITRLDVLSAGGTNYTAGTTFSLYGIKAE